MKLSPKYLDFLETNAKKEFLEGTTAAGKTTVGSFKFMLEVANSNIKHHIIAADDLGTAEKNIINPELGILDVFSDENGTVKYYSSGSGGIKIPHIKYITPNGIKIIYVCGYGDKSRWKKVLGGQVGCVYVDEVNIADMEFIREISHRCKYFIATLNPDDPNLPIYKDYINCSRPLEKYKKYYPEELLKQLDEVEKEGWIHWYFTFTDNMGLTEEDIKEKKDAVPQGTKMYRNKILGLRGKSTGLVLDLQNKQIITAEQAKKYEFVLFSCGVDTSYSKNTKDTFAFVFSGITKCRKKITLDVKVYNNKDLVKPIAPSDIPELLIIFLEYNRLVWGFAKDVYIDSADQATITELEKYKRLHGSIYNFIGAWKKLKIIDRLSLQRGWMAHGYYLILDICKPNIDEMNVYSWKEDKSNEPEDGNDHTINADQYSWIPYKDKIGG